MTESKTLNIQVVGYALKIGDKYVTITPDEAYNLFEQLCGYLGIEYECETVDNGDLN